MALTKSLAATDEEFARELLVKNNWELTPVETLVDLLSFTEVEKRMQKLFWDPAFRSAHLYLSDNLILNHLTDETGEHAIRNFIKRMLTEQFVEGTDYVEVDKNHALVQMYFNPLTSERVKPRRIGCGKRFFIVTSKCFKNMLMMSRSTKGILTRGYYIKIEDMARIVTLQVGMRRERLFEIESKNNEVKMLELSARAEELAVQKAEVLEAKAKVEAIAKEAIERKEAVIKNMASHILNSKTHTMKSFVYIAASRTLAKESLFKVGITDSMTARIKPYNTPQSGVEHKFYYAFYRECYSAWAAEKTLEVALTSFRAHDSKEVYCIRYGWLKRIVEAVLVGQVPAFEIVNELISFGKTTPEEYYSTVDVPEPAVIKAEHLRPCSSGDKPAPPPYLDDLSTGALEVVIKQAIALYMKKTYDITDFAFDATKPEYKAADGTTCKPTFSWKSFITFFKGEGNRFKKVSKLKDSAQALLKNLRAVTCRWREVPPKKAKAK